MTSLLQSEDHRFNSGRAHQNLHFPYVKESRRTGRADGRGRRDCSARLAVEPKTPEERAGALQPPSLVPVDYLPQPSQIYLVQPIGLTKVGWSTIMKERCENLVWRNQPSTKGKPEQYLTR